MHRQPRRRQLDELIGKVADENKWVRRFRRPGCGGQACWCARRFGSSIGKFEAKFMLFWLVLGLLVVVIDVLNISALHGTPRLIMANESTTRLPVASKSAPQNGLSIVGLLLVADMNFNGSRQAFSQLGRTHGFSSSSD